MVNRVPFAEPFFIDQRHNYLAVGKTLFLVALVLVSFVVLGLFIQKHLDSFYRRRTETQSAQRLQDNALGLLNALEEWQPSEKSTFAPGRDLQLMIGAELHSSRLELNPTDMKSLLRDCVFATAAYLYRLELCTDALRNQPYYIELVNQTLLIYPLADAVVKEALARLIEEACSCLPKPSISARNELFYLSGRLYDMVVEETHKVHRMDQSRRAEMVRAGQAVYPRDSMSTPNQPDSTLQCPGLVDDDVMELILRPGINQDEPGARLAASLCPLTDPSSIHILLNAFRAEMAAKQSLVRALSASEYRQYFSIKFYRLLAAHVVRFPPSIDPRQSSNHTVYLHRDQLESKPSRLP